jgi:hypothetical protein
VSLLVLPVLVRLCFGGDEVALIGARAGGFDVGQFLLIVVTSFMFSITAIW